MQPTNDAASSLQARPAGMVWPASQLLDYCTAQCSSAPSVWPSPECSRAFMRWA